jgi:hypothetical protein
MIETYKRDNINTNVQYGSNSNTIMNVANGGERLMARLGNASQSVRQALEPVVTEQTVQKALQDVQDGNINSESVALVARDTYKKTAQASVMADIEVSSTQLGDNILLGQEQSNRYDANAMNKSWEAYTKSTLQGITEPSIKASVANKLNEQGRKYFGKVATLQNKQELNKQKTSLLAKLELDSNGLKNSLGVNDEDALKYQQEIDNTFSLLVGSNLMGADEVVKKRQEINKDAYLNGTQREFKSALSQGKGQQYIDQFDKSKHGGVIDDLEKLRFKNVLEGQLADVLRKQKAQQDEYEVRNSIALDDGMKVMRTGKLPNNVSQLDNLAKEMPPKKQHEYNIIRATQAIVAKNADKPFNELETMLNEYESRPTATLLETEVASELRKEFNRRKELAKKDPISLAEQMDLVSPTNPVTLTDMSALKERSIQSVVASNFFGTKTQLLKETEVEAINQAFDDVNIGVDAKIAFLKNIENEVPEESEAVYKQLFKKDSPEYSFVGNQVKIGNEKVARLTLLGKGADVELPKGFDKELKEKLTGAFSIYDAESYNTNYKGVLNYAKGLMISGEDMDSADDVIEKSVGKIIKYSGKKTIIPIGVKQSQFEDWLDNIIVPDRPNLQEGLRDMTDVFGEGQHQLEYIGNGKYYIKNMNNGNPYYESEELDKTKPYILEYKGK